LQTLYFHLHPTLHTMSLLSSLCLSLQADGVSQEASDVSDDDDGLGGMADELGLGGAGLKGLMKNLKAQEGLIGGGGPVLGGEVLGIICERENTMSGCVGPPVDQAVLTGSEIPQHRPSTRHYSCIRHNRTTAWWSGGSRRATFPIRLTSSW
jgi:hypothetical protein